MITTIHKYELTADLRQEILMPCGAELLSVEVQEGKPFLWAMVDPSRQSMQRVICIGLTGGDCDHVAVREYVGTFHLPDEGFVGHVFDKGEQY